MKKVKKDIKVFFVGDNAQYIQTPTKDGYFGPFIGVGENEADAYRDAVYQAALSGELCANLLPKRRGSKRRGMAYYFGKDIAREHAKCEESDLYIYCIVYISK